MALIEMNNYCYKYRLHGIFFLFILQLCFAQEIEFPDLNMRTVMSRLFDDPIFIEDCEGYFCSNNEPRSALLWKPNYYEKSLLSNILEPYLHTTLDTTLFYEGNKAVVVFETSQGGCHACSPYIGIACFEKTEQKWILTYFEKFLTEFGIYGCIGEISLVTLGEKFHCLSLKSPIDMHFGVTGGYRCFYNLPNPCGRSENVFSYTYYESNAGASTDEEGFTEETEIKFVTGSPYYKIITKAKRTDTNEMIEKEYHYSKEEREYSLHSTRQYHQPKLSINNDEKKKLTLNTGSNFSADDVDIVLREHNEARRIVGSPPLQWSNEIAEFCQEWTDYLASNCCCLEHRPRTGLYKQKYGENAFMGSFGYSPGDAVNFWLEEKKAYTGYIIGNSNWKNAGHYTQAVWKKSRYIGCGKSECKGHIIIFCNYDPPGNYIGERPY